MPKKWMTREVLIGNVGVGAQNPIRIQSMTTSDTRDAKATADQIMRLADVGCEIARVTVQGKKEAQACATIKNILIQNGYTIPIVADIHFYPPAALEVIEYVDKVRVNPGNYIDKRASFKLIEYDDATYQLEIQRIFDGFTPLVLKCKSLKKAMRIGVNHGSLSDRIMSRYGDTPFGMVESALEFARVCRAHGFHNFVFSMKASNPLIMMQAYRLLVKEMQALGWDYPLHLGVTEAGEGEDGRIKSSIGMGGLLLEGIGDTIRMSLTEDPWEEIAPCKKLVSFCEEYRKQGSYIPKTYSPKRGLVFVEPSLEEILSDSFYQDIGIENGKKSHKTVDGIIFTPEHKPSLLQEKLEFLQKLDIPLIASSEVSRFSSYPLTEECKEEKIACFTYTSAYEEAVIESATEIGTFVTSNVIEGICINGPYTLRQRVDLAFNILQGCRKRHFKTDYIACPGCGRTLFGLQEVTKQIKAKTSHLAGVKIAVMGCIVNGPGEMADADFGYVGSRPGKIDLYVGKDCVEKNIDASIATEKLIDLIKSHNKWTEPAEAQ